MRTEFDLHGQSPTMQMSEPIDVKAHALPRGFAHFYAESYDFVWRCALRLGADPASVEDIVQDSFIIALRRFDDFDADSGTRPTTWLFGILRNVIRNHHRAERRRRARIERYHRTPTRRAQVRAEASLAGRLIDDFLATLDADKRAVFVLGEIEGMTGPEIARTLELNLNTANSRLRSARKAFTQHFVDEPHSRETLAQIGSLCAPARARRHALPVVAAAVYPASSGAITGFLLTGLSSKLLAGLIFLSACLASAALVVSAQTSRETREHPPTQRAAQASTVQPPSRARDNDIDTGTDVLPIEVPKVTPEHEARTEHAKVQKPALRESAPRQRELEQLASARAALLANDPARALQLVEGDTLEDGLERRRISLEISALCRLERASEAEHRARSWRAAHPDDPQASTLNHVCWTE